MKGLKIILYFINAILYLLTIALWIILNDELTLCVCVTLVTFGLTSLLIFSDRKIYRKYYESRWFKGFSSAFLSALILFFLLALVNYLFFKHPKVFDVTQDRLNSLTPQSEAVLRSLKGEIIVKVFAYKEHLLQYQNLLQLYRNVKSDFNVVLYDVELHPDVVSTHNVKQAGTIIVEMGGKSASVVEGEEIAITNALIKVARKKDPVIFFDSGHGEQDVDPKKKEGIGDFILQAQKANFIFKVGQLSTLTAIPDDVDILMIWGPRQTFHDTELVILDSFLAKGGKLLIALDPDLNKDLFKNLRELLLKRGLGIKNFLVVDKTNQVNGSNGLAPLIKGFSNEHPITQGIEGGIFFPISSVIEKTDAAIGDGRRLELLAFTSPFPGSWAESNPREFLSGEIKFSEGSDDKGPIAVVGAYENKNTQEKIVAFGNSTLISNRYEKFKQNQTLVLRSLNWLASDDLIQSFNLPLGKNEPIFIGGTQMAVIFYFSVIFVPLLLFSIAFFFFWRRRKL